MREKIMPALLLLQFQMSNEIIIIINSTLKRSATSSISFSTSNCVKNNRENNMNVNQFQFV